MPPEARGHPWGQLVEASLTEVNFKRNLASELDKVASHYSLDYRVDGTVSADRKYGVASLHASVVFHPEGEQTEPPFELSVAVTGIFEWTAPELVDEDIEGWLAFNGEHLLWPYLRSYIAQITASSGLPPLTIYTIGVPKPHFGRTDEQILSD